MKFRPALLTAVLALSIGGSPVSLLGQAKTLAFEVASLKPNTSGAQQLPRVGRVLPAVLGGTS
jgi:hypothetical protein